jgi:hypothetical protein
MKKKRRVIFGAKAIAIRAFGDETHWRSIASLMGELPIFKVGRKLAAYEDAIDAVMTKKEQAALPAAE